jgi:hypothetical protein
MAVAAKTIFEQNLIDVQYANRVGLYLSQFRVLKTRPYLARFRCPVCGDSQKNKTKARGFFYADTAAGNKLRFKCHNGCPSSTFRNFLKTQNPALFKEYVFDLYTKPVQPDHGSDIRSSDEPETEKAKLQIGTGLRQINDLEEDHPARAYCIQRRIPNSGLELLLYTPNFTKFVNSQIPGKLKDTFKEPRLIIPFTNEAGECYGFQGRSFDPDATMRYVSIMLNTDEVKCFGRHRINTNKMIYVLEGAIDSLFVDNAIASTQGDLLNVDGLFPGARKCYIPDKDRRNPQILKIIEKLIARKKSVCLLPTDLPGKDINEIVINTGMSQPQLMSMIKANTYEGLRLKLEFAKWRKM